MKAALLYNFAKSIDWPPETFALPDYTITICAIDGDPFGDTLERTIKGKIVKGREIHIRRWNTQMEPETCQILYISASRGWQLAGISNQIKGARILTVSEIERFIRQGWIINLIKEKSKIRFQINPDATEQARLTISSKLIDLAHIVGDESESLEG